MTEERRRRKVLNFLHLGKALSADVAWTDSHGEPGTTQVNVGRTGTGYWVCIEKYFNKDAFAEALYIMDDRREFDTVEEVEEFLHAAADIKLEALHG